MWAPRTWATRGPCTRALTASTAARFAGGKSTFERSIFPLRVKRMPVLSLPPCRRLLTGPLITDSSHPQGISEAVVQANVTCAIFRFRMLDAEPGTDAKPLSAQTTAIKTLQPVIVARRSPRVELVEIPAVTIFIIPARLWKFIVEFGGPDTPSAAGVIRIPNTQHPLVYTLFGG